MSSSAHSLLPMPLSPTISTPSPSTSTSTPWRDVRGASRSSSSAPSLAKATGVDSVVRSSGTRAVSAAAISPSGGSRCLVTTTQALPRLKTFAIVACRVVGVQARGEEAHLALAEDEHALGLQRGVEAGQRQPRLLRIGIADRPVEAGPSGQDLELDTGGDRCPTRASTVTRAISSAMRTFWRRGA